MGVDFHFFSCPEMAVAMSTMGSDLKGFIKTFVQILGKNICLCDVTAGSSDVFYHFTCPG